MVTPPSFKEIQDFQKAAEVPYAVAKKYLLKNYLMDELDELQRPMETCDGDINIAFQRLRSVVEYLLIHW